MSTFNLTLHFDEEDPEWDYQIANELCDMGREARWEDFDLSQGGDLFDASQKVMGRIWIEPTPREIFELRIELGDAVQSEADVADALERAAEMLRTPCRGSEFEGLVRGADGNAVGHFGLASGPLCPEEDPVMP